MSKTIKHTRKGYIIAIVILGVLLATFITLYAVSASQNAGNLNALENIYQKNFYDLVDNVNNTENKLAKAISATDNKMKAKYLMEVSDNARLAGVSFNNLPYSQGAVQTTVGFVNQVSGYTETLAKNLEQGQSLSQKDAQTLEEVYDSVLYMKGILAEINTEMWDGYQIASASKKFEGENNALTNSLLRVKNVDVDYPTMIYDGPFSDSVINKAVKGLKQSDVSQDTAKKNLLKIFTSLEDEDVEFQGDATGRFETYNFSCKNADNKEFMFVQMTKKGGHLLTATSYTDNKAEEISIETAREVAMKFAVRAGIDNAKVVWSDVIAGNAYINIAPVENNYILYPDLVKVKVDLANGDVLGYEATGYYTNHVSRTLSAPTITKSEVQKFVPNNYKIVSTRLALIPLEYNQEVLCWEIACTLGADEYYFYFNTETGEEENILKVLQTNNGNLLM